jgi:tRNA threonylcarbamoyladenosine biosynthesis protein TsaB
VIVLGIETATDRTGIAIGSDDELLACFQLTHRRLHAETLAPAIAFVCQQSNLELSTVDVIAVDQGPGLFTGLRVGLASAKALAYALHKPIVGVCSLDVLAFAARLVEANVVCVLDALKGEVFFASFFADGSTV